MDTYYHNLMHLAIQRNDLKTQMISHKQNEELNNTKNLQQQQKESHFVNDLIKATIIYKPISNLQYYLQRLFYAKESAGYEPKNVTNLKLKAIAAKSGSQEILRLIIPIFALNTVDKLLNSIDPDTDSKFLNTLTSDRNKILIIGLTNIVTEILTRFPAENVVSLFVNEKQKSFFKPSLQALAKNKSVWTIILMFGGLFTLNKFADQKIKNKKNTEKHKENITFSEGLGISYLMGRLAATALYTFQQVRDGLSLIPKTPNFIPLRKGRALSIGIRSLGQDLFRLFIPVTSMILVDNVFNKNKNKDSAMPWVLGAFLAVTDVLYRRLGRDIFSVFVHKTPTLQDGKSIQLESLKIPSVKDMSKNIPFLRATAITILFGSAISVGYQKLKDNQHKTSSQ